MRSPCGVTRTIDVASRTETAQLAQILARELRAGDLLLLDGPLGSGKTAFVQSLAKCLGADETPNSPTFNLATFYDCGPIELIHCDLYRLSSVAEFQDLGIDDFMDEAITAVEWGAKLRSAYPEHLLVQIHTMATATARRVVVSSACERWAKPLLRLSFGDLKVTL